MSNETGLPTGIEKDSQAHVDWLMVPRIICLGKEWSKCTTCLRYMSGDILQQGKSDPQYWDYIMGALLSIKMNPADYPRLFRPLQWWENRSPEQMPGYVKLILQSDSTEIVDMIKWDFANKSFTLKSEPVKTFALKSSLQSGFVTPATRAEYEQYLTAINGTKS